MTLRLPPGIVLLPVVGLGLTVPGLAQAATANCMSPDGTCEVSNDGMDWIDCMCANGGGGGGGGGNAWAGLSEMELQPICDEQLALFCGMVPPPLGIPCMNAFGTCYIDNDPQDSLICECDDGSGGGIGGGMAWAGLSEAELLGICQMEVDNFCFAPPIGIPCGTVNGSCEIYNQPFDWIECTCADGSQVGLGGGMAWGG